MHKFRDTGKGTNFMKQNSDNNSNNNIIWKTQNWDILHNYYQD